MTEADRESIFQGLYTKYFSLIYQVAWRVTHDEAVSEEMAQEAFIRYYERMDRLPLGDEARYWLLRVVKNLCFNHQKRKGREFRANQRYQNEPRKVLVNDGENNLLEAESRDIVKEALDRLPDKLKEVMVLKEYGNLNYREIGEVLKISEGNVKIRVFRARQILSETLIKGEVHVP